MNLFNRRIASGRTAAIGLAILFLLQSATAAEPPAELAIDPRRPSNERELRRWLENMIWYHRFSDDEIHAATGLSVDEVQAARERWQLHPDGRPERNVTDPLLVLPYPGGRHPRIGFLDGAVRPQRETKLSVFTPWDPTSYVVLDVPEAIWSNLGLTYLAHTHIPTYWDQQQVSLPKQEWRTPAPAQFVSERTLPNGISFGTEVHSHADHVAMRMWLTNGTHDLLSDLRVQNCVLLKGAKGFERQTNDNKIFVGPYVACHSPGKDRWIIVAWTPLHRAWGNAPCPCLHSDPKFPDCPPGQTQYLHGRLSFYEGTAIQAEIARIDASDWRNGGWGGGGGPLP